MVFHDEDVSCGGVTIRGRGRHPGYALAPGGASAAKSRTRESLGVLTAGASQALAEKRHVVLGLRSARQQATVLGVHQHLTGYPGASGQTSSSGKLSAIPSRLARGRR